MQKYEKQVGGQKKPLFFYLIRKVYQNLRNYDTDFDTLEEKDAVNAVKTVAIVVGMIPKLIKDLAEAEKAVNKELEEQGNARGYQEITIFDLDDE